MKFCYNCGSLLSAGQYLCKMCGAPVTPEPESQVTVEEAPVCDTTLTKASVETVGTLYYAGFILLYSLPLVGLIASIAMAIGCRKNESKRNFAKAFLFFNLTSAVLCVAAGIVISLFSIELQAFLKELPL